MKPACEIYLCILAEFAWTRIWVPGSEEFVEKRGRALFRRGELAPQLSVYESIWYHYFFAQYLGQLFLWLNTLPKSQLHHSFSMH